MSNWIEIVKAGKPTDYTGTCPKCGKYIGGYMSKRAECPLNLPAPPLKPSCPMRAERAK